jgi:hypothetical protein
MRSQQASSTASRPGFFGSLRAGLVVLVACVAPPAVWSQHSSPPSAGSAPADSVAVPSTGASASGRTGPERRSIEFSPANIAIAFDYLDKNRDGRISREEAAAFSGVARYFDRADVDGDGSLSREEFVNAMNRAKTR